MFDTFLLLRIELPKKSQPLKTDNFHDIIKLLVFVLPL